MWRNEETREFVDWLHERNIALSKDRRTAFYGLDLYSLYNSARAVINYLDGVDPELAAIARARYGCLTPRGGRSGCLWPSRAQRHISKV